MFYRCDEVVLTMNARELFKNTFLLPVLQAPDCIVDTGCDQTDIEIFSWAGTSPGNIPHTSAPI